MSKFLTKIEIEEGNLVKFSPFYHERDHIKGFTKEVGEDNWDHITYWVKSSYDRRVRKVILN